MTQTVVRATGPREVLALVEHTLGFRPSESVVVVSLRGPRRRSGLVARLDLVPTPSAAALEALAERVRADGAADALVLVHTDAPLPPPRRDGRTRLDALPAAAPVRALRAQLRRRGATPVDAWLVAGGRVVSYTCDLPCCPPLGRAADPVGTQVAAEMVLAGSAVDADRVAWERRETAALAPGGAAARRLAEAAARRYPAAGGAAGALAWWCDVLETATADVRDGRSPSEAAAELVTPAAAGRALAALEDHRLRDAVLVTLVPGALHAAEAVLGGAEDAGGVLDRALGPGRGAGPTAPDPDVLVAAEELLRALVRAAPPGRRAEPLAVLAWASWWRGAGPQAALRARLALRAQPGHVLGDLVRRAAEAGVPPPWVAVEDRSDDSGAQGGTSTQ